MAGKSTNAMKQRRSNERIALAHIRQKGKASKAEIARMADLTPAGAGLIVDALESAGFINTVGKRFGRRGSPSVLYALNADRVFSIGFKIGRLTLETIMVDFVGRERARQEHDYSWPDPAFVRRAGIEALEKFRQQIEQCRATELSGIGIAVPYFLGGWGGELRFPEDLGSRWAATDLHTLFADDIGLPVYVENDASAAALGELVFGDGACLRDFMHISVDTLVGGGLVQDGKLQTGPHGNGAALGPLPVSPSAVSPVPAGGTRLLHRASAFTLLEHLRRHGHPVGRIQDLELETHHELPAVAAWLEDCAEALVEAIVAIASVVDIEAVVLDSVLPGTLNNRLLNLVQTRFGRASLAGIVPPAIIGGSFGARTASVGAAALPLSAFLDESSPVHLTAGKARSALNRSTSRARPNERA